MLIEMQAIQVNQGNASILRDVNLSLDKGSIYGLIGPNGAGKTTTIAAALGLMPVSSGLVRVLGKDPWTQSRFVHARTGALPEQSGFYEWMSAEEYLAFFGNLYERPLTRGEIAHCLSQVALTPRPGQRISTFSRGMRQRLGLARALIPEPELIILDEPTNGLDPRGRRELHDILQELAADGIGVLLCTHLLDDVERLCDRIGVLVSGRTVVEGGLTDLLSANGLSQRFLIRLSAEAPPDEPHPHEASILTGNGGWRIVDIAAKAKPEEVWRKFYALGWPLVEIKRENTGLEALYLALTEGGTA